MIIPVFTTAFFEKLDLFFLGTIYGSGCLYLCCLLRDAAEDTSDEKEKRNYITLRRIIIGTYIVIILRIINQILS